MAHRIIVTNVHVAEQAHERLPDKQFCARCGELLIDNRGVDSPDGSPPGYFSAGTLVEKHQSKNLQGVSSVSPVICDIQFCGHSPLLDAREALQEIKRFNRLNHDTDAYLFDVAKWGLGERESRPTLDEFGI